MSKAESAPSKIRILIVDDHPIVREGLTMLIHREKDMTVCAEAGTCAEALRLLDEQKPDLAVVDLSIKDGNGLELTKDMKIRRPRMPVLILSMHDEMVYAERALKAGARGYLMKDNARANIINALRHILSGQIYLSDRVGQVILSKVVTGQATRSANPAEALSDRELEVFRLLGEGLGTREIATRLHRSIRTIDAHRENIKRKLNLNNATELLQQAIRWVQSQGV